MSMAKITNGSSAQLIPTGVAGTLTDIIAAATASAGSVALYDGTSTSAPLLFIQKLGGGESASTPDHRIRFGPSGVYASLSNIESLIVHGDWAKVPGAVRLSGN